MYSPQQRSKLVSDQKKRPKDTPSSGVMEPSQKWKALGVTTDFSQTKPRYYYFKLATPLYYCITAPHSSPGKKVRKGTEVSRIDSPGDRLNQASRKSRGG